MKKNNLAVLFLKLLGIYITVQGIASIGSAFGMRGLSRIDSWSLYFGIFVYLISGIFLILSAKFISGYILPLDDKISSDFEISESFQKAALRIIGIYITVFSIPPMINIIGQMIQYGFWGSDIPNYMKETPNFIVPLISQLVHFILGVFLALGPNSVIKALSRFDKSIEKMGT